MDHVLEVVVSNVLMLMLMSMQPEELTSRNMCCPELIPQMTGGGFMPGLEMVILSSTHFPMEDLSAVAVDLATGPVMSNVFRSSLILHTLARGQMVYLQGVMPPL